ncbi:MAG TPA: hypothetical protein VIS07_03475 [Candidatus Binatia bacterium]
MKTLRVAIALALVLTASSALANQAKFQGLIRKYAVDLDSVPTLGASLQKAKTPCLCFEPSFLRNRYGYLISQFDPSDKRIAAGCYVPTFDDGGALSTVYTCTSYTPLGK